MTLTVGSRKMLGLAGVWSSHFA